MPPSSPWLFPLAARPKPRSPPSRPRSKHRSPLLKLRSLLILPPLPLLPLLLLRPLLLLLLRLPLLLLPRLPPLPLLRLPLLLLPRLPPPPLLRLPLLLRRSNSSPAFGQEKASRRAGFFCVPDIHGEMSNRCIPGSQIAPGEPLILGRDPDPVLPATQRGGQGCPRQCRRVVLCRKVRGNHMLQS